MAKFLGTVEGSLSWLNKPVPAWLMLFGFFVLVLISMGKRYMIYVDGKEFQLYALMSTAGPDQQKLYIPTYAQRGSK